MSSGRRQTEQHLPSSCCYSDMDGARRDSEILSRRSLQFPSAASICMLFTYQSAGCIVLYPPTTYGLSHCSVPMINCRLLAEQSSQIDLTLPQCCQIRILGYTIWRDLFRPIWLLLHRSSATVFSYGFLSRHLKVSNRLHIQVSLWSFRSQMSVSCKEVCCFTSGWHWEIFYGG